jgi:hypothetical protein
LHDTCIYSASGQAPMSALSLNALNEQLSGNGSFVPILLQKSPMWRGWTFSRLGGGLVLTARSEGAATWTHSRT